MKIYKLPEKISALVFDMDLTLYTSLEYGKAQNDGLVGRLGEVLGKSFEETDKEVNEYRRSFSASHGGEKPSLTSVLLNYGISMTDNVRWREEICEPVRFIGEDKKLAETLRELSTFYALGVVTNNPVLVARKTLTVLGVEDYFGALVGLDTCMAAKPGRLPFIKITGLLGCGAETCVSIGDRYDIDLALPIELGMGGILVDGVEDVYRLPEVLGTRGKEE
ncbi:MAG: HAD family hydrolase [Treponema sp.]|jgi:phosphoglycolate phosphatase/putative hydrolase of the HAD superfamily|nr:HAD family hydrolase [Treponema sp.]